MSLQPLAAGQALNLKVRADPGHILVGVVHGAVDDDDGDAGLVALSQNGVPAGGHDGVDDDVIHALLDETADSLQLLGGVVVAVHEGQLIAVGRGEHVLSRLGGGGTPVGLVAHLGKAHQDVAVAGAGRASRRGASRRGAGGRGIAAGGRGVAAAAGHQRQGHGRSQGKRKNLLHFTSSLSVVTAFPYGRPPLSLATAGLH